MQFFFNVHMFVSFLNRLENGISVTMEIEPHGWRRCLWFFNIHKSFVETRPEKCNNVENVKNTFFSFFIDFILPLRPKPL